jgi:hypothetical protein
LISATALCEAVWLSARSSIVLPPVPPAIAVGRNRLEVRWSLTASIVIPLIDELTADHDLCFRFNEMTVERRHGRSSAGRCSRSQESDPEAGDPT